MNVNKIIKNLQKNEKRQITDDEYEMKEGIELPSEGEEVECNYEILSSQEKHPSKYDKNLNYSNNKSVKNQNNTQNTPQNINLDKLRQKVTEQAHRLTQLETYKNLCENRIKQLAPTHPIPLSDSDMKTPPSLYTSNLNDLKSKESEINQLKKKIEALENVSNNSISNSANKKTKPGHGSKGLAYENFPTTLDNIPLERAKDLYSKLRHITKDLSDEKEIILDTLRTETINNEEQRNYIEILRQTIESSILKNGLTPFLMSVKSTHPEFYNNESPNLDVLVDLSQIKGESDKYRKELIMAQVLISELKYEVDFLKNTNEEMNLKRQKIKESLESGLKELDEAKLQVNILDQEKNHLNENYSDEKIFNQKLKNEIQDILNVNKKIERDLNEQIRKNSELQNQLQNQNLLNNKINDFKISFEQLYQNYEKIMKEKTNLEIECSKLNEEVKSKKSEIEKLNLNHADREERNEKEKKSLVNDNENSKEMNRNQDKQINDQFALINTKEREIKRLEEKVSALENNLSNLKKSLNESENKIENLEKRLRDQNYLITELKDSLQHTSRDKEIFYKDLTELRNSFENINRDNSNMKYQIEQKDRDFLNLEEQFETLYKNNHHLEDEFLRSKNDIENLKKENHYWKEKYDKDITTKIGEINVLNKELVNLTRNFEEVNCQKSRLESELETKENFITKLKEHNRNYSCDILTLEANCEEYKKKIEKLNSELEKEVKANYELNTLTNHMTMKLEEAVRNLQLIGVEKDKLEASRKKLGEEAEVLRRADKESNIKIHSLNSTLNEIKAASQSSDVLLRNMIEKFKGMIKNFESNSNNSNNHLNNSHLFTKNFLFNLKEDNERNIKSVSDIVRNNEDWLRILFNELEIWHEDQKSNLKKLEDFSMKNKMLEDSIHRVELANEKHLMNEIKVQSHVKGLEEEKKVLTQENENLHKLNNKTTTELKSQNLENKEFKEENLVLEEELTDLKKINEELLQENNEKHTKLSNANFQIDALEERIVIVVKEKRYLDSLLVRVAKSHPSSDVSRIVNEIMNLNDSLSQLERDRLKVLDSISQLNEASCRTKNDSTANNQILEHSIRREKENLKSLSTEYEKKILHKKEHIRNLENEMRNVEINEKQYQEIIYDYELKIKLLHRDLKEAIDELRRIKTRNLNKWEETGSQNIIDSHSQKLPRENLFLNKNVIISKNQLNATNYDSIEFSNEVGRDNMDMDAHLDSPPSKDVDRLDRMDRLRQSKERERQLNSLSYNRDGVKANDNSRISKTGYENRQINKNNRSYLSHDHRNLNEDNF